MTEVKFQFVMFTQQSKFSLVDVEHYFFCITSVEILPFNYSGHLICFHFSSIWIRLVTYLFLRTSTGYFFVFFDFTQHVTLKMMTRIDIKFTKIIWRHPSKMKFQAKAGPMIKTHFIDMLNGRWDWTIYRGLYFLYMYSIYLYVTTL